MPIKTVCSNCGKEIQQSPSQYNRSKDHFCSRQCHMQKLNRDLNPTRMREETKQKISVGHMKLGAQKTYAKQGHRHIHRAVAESMLGRALLPGEVVHHIDGNRRNNNPENLMIFSSQAEHARWHAQHKKEVIA